VETRGAAAADCCVTIDEVDELCLWVVAVAADLYFKKKETHRHSRHTVCAGPLAACPGADC